MNSEEMVKERLKIELNQRHRMMPIEIFKHDWMKDSKDLLLLLLLLLVLLISKKKEYLTPIGCPWKRISACLSGKKVLFSEPLIE
jgi:hypothetical protein